MKTRVGVRVLQSLLTFSTVVTWCVFAPALPASACSALFHCYGVADWVPTPAQHGGGGNLNVHCLKLPTPDDDFINAEYWAGTNGGASPPYDDYWVEAGMKYGAPIGAQREWFWADKGPNLGYNEHYKPDLAAALNVVRVTHSLRRERNVER
jgi:hypothetical protein